MEKKRPVGVIVFGIIGIIIGSAVLFYLSMLEINPEIRSRNFLFPLHLTVGISFIVSGIAMFKLRNWGRILFLWLMIIYSLFGLVIAFVFYILSYRPYDPQMYRFVYEFGLPVGIYVAFFLLPSVTSIYYFTRHKVKEQFR